MQKPILSHRLQVRRSRPIEPTDVAIGVLAHPPAATASWTSVTSIAPQSNFLSDSRYNTLAMISKDLLDMLVCPVCKKPVVLNANGQSLKCGVCRRVYPIQDDIPIMLVDVATIDVA